MSGMMNGYHDFMSIQGGSTELIAVLSILGLVSGVIMVVGATMLRAHP
jgi:hypothetical protein